MAIPSNIITAFDAKNRLGNLLERVKSGEILIITRHGEPVAKLVPIEAEQVDSITKALQTFKKVRQSLSAAKVKVTSKEIKNWRSEGRR